MDTLDSVWITICVGLVFMMQAGFLCLESGLTRKKNSINVAMKNIADISVAIVIFWLLGFGIIFGESYNGWFGSSFFLIQNDQAPDILLFFLFQAMFCGTAITIISGAIAERIKFSSYLIITVVIATFIYPFLGHWVWGGYLTDTGGWLFEMGFIDFAGSTVVHSVGGWSALALLIIIGPRKNRFKRDGTPSNIQANDLPMAMMGVLILWFGWIGFNGGSVLAFNRTVIIAIINTVMAGCSGLITSLILERFIYKYYSPKSSLNGVLAGLVAITASCNIVSIHSAIIIGGIGAVFVSLTDYLLLRFKIDDAVSAVPVHLAAGIWGTIAVAIFAPLSSFTEGFSRLDQLYVQGVGVLATAIWAFGLTYIICWIINKLSPLRIDQSMEYIGLNVSEHQASNELNDLINTLNKQAETNDLSLRVSIDPFSETGQIATHYNRTMDTLENAALELKKNKEKYETISNCSPIGIFNLDREGHCTFVNNTWRDIFTISPLEYMKNWSTYTGSDEALLLLKKWALILIEKNQINQEEAFKNSVGETCHLYVQVIAEMSDDDKIIGYIGTVSDITLRVQLQSQLKQTQKMESVGQLAAGIAHEINSPLQFVSSNTTFIQDSFDDFLSLQTLYTQLVSQIKAGKETDLLLDKIQSHQTDKDIEYLMQEVPMAIDQTMDGINRVSVIVGAMKEFTHPVNNEFSKSNLHRVINSALLLSSNSWKHITYIRKSFEENLPLIDCIESEISQALICFINNAAYAIEEEQAKLSKTAEKGIIHITTKNLSEHIEIQIQDSGTGISDDIKDKVFDPFFTTKGAGKGSGQGLSCAYNIIVKAHKGSIEVKPPRFKGALFIISIPKTHQENAT
jgi:Amt family ammonium transporter